MATQTLVEAAKLIQNDLISGIAENIITTNPFWAYLPWTSYTGQAIVVNTENTLGDMQFLAVGGVITAKAASTNTQQTFTATTLIGDAEVNGIVAAQSASAGVEQMGIEVTSKSKAAGIAMQQGIATGDATGANMSSLHSLCDASQYTTASIGQALSFELLDELLALVKSKHGAVDYILMNQSQLNKYKILVRSLGGNTKDVVFQDPAMDGFRSIYEYEGIPIFINDYIGSTETANGAALVGGLLTSVYAGVFDDGTSKVGCAMIHPASTPAGLAVELIGAKETKDENITRIKSYMNFVLYNKLGLARLTSLN